ncbi:hypothetical protein HanXRQr2_Chr03g0118591 [Helianthus annuus]|uniref:Uncharacterized protein n=1 Tax=Helianthus annuus TaxID=4232 RepID=A0A9K3NXH8_HELAN|nr:hypothetical protein HanXRQr2_Chr03g0118591 [Helianthus annuus]KAJ0944319.1 hypothetical protein HanPSC8_Chr03g0115231 [Helianthus annuus]
MFFANVVVKAAQILMEEEDVSSESVITRRIRINRDRQGFAREIGERLFFGCTPLQCRHFQTKVPNESPVIHTDC